MKLGVYFRESWHNLRSDKLYTLVYIIAVAFSLAIVMTYLTVVAMRTQNSYPETHRDRMLSIPLIYLELGTTSSMEQSVSKDFIAQFLSEPLPGVEAWTAVKTEEFKVYNSAGEPLKMVVEFIDSSFTDIFPLEVLYGGPITADGALRNVPDVLMAESAAAALLGRKDVVGESIFFNNKEYRICGVVRDVPQTATYAFAQIWVPDTEPTLMDVQLREWALANNNNVMVGPYEIELLAGSRRDFSAIRSEMQDRIDRYNQSGVSSWKLSLAYGMPTVRERIFMYDSAAAYTWIGVVVVLLVLLVPVFNLSGMTGSGMEARMAEFGVRKSFGAWRGAIVRQIVGENLLLTLIGGAVGLLLSYLLLYLLQDELYDLLPLNSMVEFGYFEFIPAPAFTFRSFFKVSLYLLLLALVLVVNLLSALVPASKVIRRPITESLNSQR